MITCLETRPDAAKEHMRLEGPRPKNGWTKSKHPDQPAREPAAWRYSRRTHATREPTMIFGGFWIYAQDMRMSTLSKQDIRTSPESLVKSFSIHRSTGLLQPIFRLIRKELEFWIYNGFLMN